MSYIGNTLGPNGENYGRSGAVQPIAALPSQIAASDGTITFTFPHVALGQVWTGTINVGSAPDSANFTAGTGATTFGQFKGSNSWGPVQLGGGDQLVVTGTGLIPGTNYQCSFQGAAVTGADPGIIYPSSYADTVTTSTEQLQLGTIKVRPPSSTTTTYTLSIPVPPSYRSLYLIFYNPGAGLIPSSVTFNVTQAQGNTSFTNYPILQPSIYSTYAGSQYYVRIPITPNVDNSITVTYTMTTSTSPVIVSLYYGADLAVLDMAVYQEGTWNVGIIGTPTISGTVAVSSVAGTVTVDNATGNGIEVYEVGGLSSASVAAGTSLTTLLAAPASGYAYRIHSISMNFVTGVRTNFFTNSNVFGVLIAGTQQQATMNGLTTTGSISVTGSATGAIVYIFYDLITTPTIS